MPRLPTVRFYYINQIENRIVYSNISRSLSFQTINVAHVVHSFREKSRIIRYMVKKNTFLFACADTS